MDAPLVPSCAVDGGTFPQPPVERNIDDFCGNKQFWDRVIVPHISIGTGVTDKGNRKTPGVNASYAIEGTNDKLWLGLYFSNKNCIGRFQFTIGNNDEERVNHCKDRFRTVLNGCQTDTIKDKKGGELNDACAIYSMTRSKINPWGDWNKDQGDLTCQDTDVRALGERYDGPLKGTCTCWLSGRPGLTDLFKMPESGNCDPKEVDRTALLNN
jgi:hypothetical protein